MSIDSKIADAANLEDFPLILNTLRRSNVLLWWAHVTRKGSTYDWKIRTPPQLRENPIYGLAAMLKEGGLWLNEQSPDQNRMDQSSKRALEVGANGYQQEFRIIGLDGIHWLSEEVIIQPAGPNEWNLAGVIIDVTKLHEAEVKYRAIFENAREGILLTTPEGTIEIANPALARMFGYESADSFIHEVPNMSSLYVDTAKRADLQRLITECGKVVDFEAQMRRRDGTLIWVVLNIQLVVDKHGDQHYEETLQDVTERKLAKEALMEEQALFASLVNTIPDHIYFKDRQSRFIRINRAMAQALELREVSEAVGKTDFDIFSEEHASQAFADEQRVMEAGQAMIGVEEKETWPDGHVTWVSTTKMPMRDAQGKITGMLGISRDVTERKLADARLREQNEILTQSNEGVMIISLANEIALWNRGAEEILGWTASEALGQAPKTLLGEEDDEAWSKMLAAIERDAFWTGELRMKTRDGQQKTLEFHITLVHDDAGRPRARLSIFSDVTEKKLLEEKLFHMQRIETIGMLATGIAHDLNNVLAPITFAAPLLRESLTTPRDLKLLEALSKCAERGAGLVKQILGFARSTAGEFQDTQVKHILRDIINTIEETFPKSIRFEQVIPFDLWPVRGNATQIHQVLLNLCVNARDAMPQGGTLRVAAANRRLNAAEVSSIRGGRPGSWLVLEVGDTGTGIPPEVLERIWTPFFTTKGVGKGTGLGLSTVRGIVDNHHGFIELQTEVGRGTTFRVFLPAVEGETSITVTTSPFQIPDGKGELILLVDDDVAVRDSGTALLEKHGYRVVNCVDGVEAIVVFISRAAEISLVITDIDMPRIAGAELARMLSKIRPEIPILGISGLPAGDTDGSGIHAAKKLTRDFLTKPIQPVHLLKAVHRLLHPDEKA